MRLVHTGLLIALALTLLAAPALAQHASPRVTYQGFMTDNINNPITANGVPVEVRLWADAALTTLLFREAHTVDVVNGRFSLEIGAGTLPGGAPTPAHTALDQVPFGSPVFFTLVINAEETNAIEFNFTPFAFFTLDSERVGGQLLSDLDARYITTLGGQTVAGALTVDGTLTVASGVLTAPATGDVVIAPSGGIVDLQGDTSVTGLLTVTGNTSLTGLLDVTGDTTITGSLTVTDGVNDILTASRTGSTTTVQALDNAGLPFLTATNDGANSSLTLRDGATTLLSANAGGLDLASGGLSMGGTATIGSDRSGMFTGLSLGLRNLVGPTTYAAQTNDHVLIGDVQTSDVEIDLPDIATTDDGRMLRIVRVDPTTSSTSSVIIRPHSSDTIGGNFTLGSPLIVDGTSFAQAILLVADFSNSDWRILDTGGGTGGAISASSATINPGPLVVDNGATQTTVLGGTINTVDLIVSNSITSNTISGNAIDGTSITDGTATLNGGDLTGANSVTATTGTFTNLLSGNVTITGGTLDAVGITNSTFDGTVNVTGGTLDSVTITNSTISGNGAGLTDLDASNITTGALADARLSANVFFADGTRPMTGDLDLATNNLNNVGTLNASAGNISVLSTSAITVTGGTLDGVAITNSAIDSTPIGATTPDTGAFTTVDTGSLTDGTATLTTGALTGLSTLDTSAATIGGLTVGYVRVTGPTIHALQPDDHTICAIVQPAGGVVINLPPAVDGRLVRVIRVDPASTGQLVQINAAPGETINGLPTLSISSASLFQTVTVTGDTFGTPDWKVTELPVVVDLDIGGNLTVQGTGTFQGLLTANAGADINGAPLNANNGANVTGGLNADSATVTGLLTATDLSTGNATITGGTLSGVGITASTFDGTVNITGGALDSVAITNSSFGGTVNITGGAIDSVTITNSTISGNGAGLTDLDASNITTGTLADARLTTNVFFVDGSRAMGGDFDGGGFNVGNVNNLSASTLAGNGAAITDLDAANVATGTLDDNRLSANVFFADGTRPMTGNFDGGGFDVANVNSLSANTLAGNGAALTDLDASNVTAGTLADARLTANVFFADGTRPMTGNFDGGGFDIANVVTITADNVNALTLTGDGAGISNLNASNIATGTLADARLTANVFFADGTRPMTGNFNGGGFDIVNVNSLSANTLAGNGAAITNLDANNITAGTLADARLTSNVFFVDGTRPMTGNFDGGNFDVSNVNSLTATALNGGSLSIGAGNATISNAGNARIAGLTAGYRLVTTGPTNVTPQDYTIDVNAGSPLLVNLEDLATVQPGRIIVVMRSGPGDVTVDANGAQTIDGNLTAAINNGSVQQSLVLVAASATEWKSLGASNATFPTTLTLGVINGNPNLTVNAGTIALNGNTNVTGTLSSTNTLTVSGGGASITGATNIAGNTTVTGNVLPGVATNNLGSGAARWNSVFATALDANAATVSGTAAVGALVATSASIATTTTTADLSVTGNVTSNLIPVPARDLGNGSNRWQALFAGNVDATNALIGNLLTLGGSARVAGNIIANAAGTTDIGAVGTPFRAVFANDLNSANVFTGTIINPGIGAVLINDDVIIGGDLDMSGNTLSNVVLSGVTFTGGTTLSGDLDLANFDLLNGDVLNANTIRLNAAGGLDSVLLNGGGTPFIYSGTATLAGGTVTIPLAGVTSGSIVTATHRSAMTGDAAGLLTATAGAGSITINSSFPGDINDINYIVIVNP